MCVCVCECVCMCVHTEPMMMAEASEVSLNCLQPHPLPMPAYGGYYAPLSQFLPTSGSLPTPPYQRSVPACQSFSGSESGGDCGSCSDAY